MKHVLCSPGAAWRYLWSANAASHLLLVAAAFVMVGCVTSAPTDPTTHPQAVVFPLFDLRADKSIKIQCDPSRPISEKFLGAQIQCIIHQATNEGLRANFTVNDLETANREVLKKIPTKGEQYAFILALSEWHFASTGFTFKFDMTAYLVRVSTGEVVWKNRWNGGRWRGIIQGPLEKLQGGAPYDFHYGNLLMETLRKTPRNLPL